MSICSSRTVCVRGDEGVFITKYRIFSVVSCSFVTEYFPVVVLILVLQLRVLAQYCSLSEWITWSRAADLFDSSLLWLSAAAWQQSFSLVAKTVKFIPSHSSNCHRGETESRLSHLWEIAAHDNDPAHFSSLSFDNKTVQATLKLLYGGFHQKRPQINTFYTSVYVFQL